MSFHKRLIQQLLVVVIVALIAATPAESQAKPGCPETCGNLTIPYPFGTSESCYLDETFLITCNESKAQLGNGNIDVLNISLDGELIVSTWIAFDCYTESGGLDSHYDHCITDVVNGTCSGIGCCQTSIPRGVIDFNLTVKSYYNHSGVWNFNPCSYAFIVEDGIYTFASVDLYNLSTYKMLPVVLDWAVDSKTCEEARKNMSSYSCGNNTTCYDSDNAPGYRCNCSQGYQGISSRWLPSWYILSARVSLVLVKINCMQILMSARLLDSIRAQISVTTRLGTSLVLAQSGISTSLLFFCVIAVFVYWAKQKRKNTKAREDCFKQNGGVMLQEQLSKGENSDQVAKLFTEEELRKATKNFNESCVIGQGGFGTVYKGTLADNRVVAIKKSKLVDLDQINQFVTEVKILSQIDHPNVVKLLGCCLETPVPLLVYEFITNNALFHHLHDEARVSSIPWESRLRIAAETAVALAHMHSTTQIIHRDIKSANILLNDEYTAKVSDFGISKFVPSGKTHLTTLVQGTFGYIDPEYFHSGNLTEKSDVYSFGVVLVELLSGEMVVSFERPEKDRSLAAYFVSSMEENCLFQILEDRVKREGDVEQLKGVAEVAKRCLELKGDRRPTMEEVKEELEALRKFEKHSRPDQIGSDIEERDPLLYKPLDFYGKSASTVFDDTKNQAKFQMDSRGR
ncbi:putative wall-associated receptor kinase-like 16 [Cornus florida]|uniref:putative wall-associated receptor kinase-like 16 n=1 Tax=Cornus florida TaxID=4283 RepID=UPI00289B325E|nr:putative wall-associated receptor kinase-like 16 [Cornus florida]